MFSTGMQQHVLKKGTPRMMRLQLCELLLNVLDAANLDDLFAPKNRLCGDWRLTACQYNFIFQTWKKKIGWLVKFVASPREKNFWTWTSNNRIHPRLLRAALMSDETAAAAAASSSSIVDESAKAEGLLSWIHCCHKTFVEVCNYLD